MMRNLLHRGDKHELARREDGGLDLFGALQGQMNRLFEQFHRDFELAPFGQLRMGNWMPLVNISENDKEICVSAELPGLDEKDISVTLTRNVLTIKGEKTEETEKKGRHYHRVERSFGSFYRDIPLPWEVEADRVEAAFKKGVLTVTLPKTKESQKEAKEIRIAKA